MTPEQQRITILEACGWYEEDNESLVCWTRDDLTYCEPIEALPNYPRSFQALREAEIKFGLHNTDNLELRVKWINSLRMVVSRRCPKNNSGSPMVSDIDLLNASEEERCEALVRAIGKWPKKNLQTQNQQNEQDLPNI